MAGATLIAYSIVWLAVILAEKPEEQNGKETSKKLT